MRNNFSVLCGKELLRRGVEGKQLKRFRSETFVDGALNNEYSFIFREL